MFLPVIRGGKKVRGRVVPTRVSGFEKAAFLKKGGFYRGIASQEKNLHSFPFDLIALEGDLWVNRFLALGHLDWAVGQRTMSVDPLGERSE